jgi:hypothetical protein
MADLSTAYATYYEPVNSNVGKTQTSFDFGEQKFSKLSNEKYQEHKQFNDRDFEYGGMNYVFCNEPVGKLFFSNENVKRIQGLIKKEIYEKTYHKFIVEEDQDPSDLLIAMRAMYMEQGIYREDNPVRQVKQLNKRIVDFVVPDMITEIKQYYGYLKDINEPLKPIARPMNVCNAGRRSLPSITTTWTR